MKIEVSKLTNDQLDWAVAKCEGFDALAYEKRRLEILHRRDDAQPRHFQPSTDPAQGQPIIEAAKISVIWAGEWYAYGRDTPEGDRNPDGYGETALIAAMRCRVVLKLGQEVDIPEEML